MVARRRADRADVRQGRPPALVWVDSREALVARWDGADPRVERVVSEVPPHHRSTGHVRHDPTVRHGGGGPRQTADEPHRREHLVRFLERLADRLAGAGDIVLLGPGVVRERLERRIRELDVRHRARRAVASEAAPRLTRRQLVARLRRVAGEEPRRRVVGAGAPVEDGRVRR